MILVTAALFDVSGAALQLRKETTWRKEERIVVRCIDGSMDGMDGWII